MQLSARHQEMTSVHSRTTLDADDQWTKGHTVLDLLLTDENWWMM